VNRWAVMTYRVAIFETETGDYDAALALAKSMVQDRPRGAVRLVEILDGRIYKRQIVARERKGQ
jgi:hypothetical protein